MALVVPAFFLALAAATLVFGRARVVLAIALLRPSCDQVFNQFKESGASGPGAAVNLIVILVAISCLMQFPALLACPAILGALAFLAAALASMLHGPDPAGGMRLFLTLATYTSVLVLAYFIVRDRAKARVVLGVAVFSSVIPSLYSLVGIIGVADTFDEDHRLQSTFTHPNIYAFYLVALVTVLLFLAYSETLALSRRARFWIMPYVLLQVGLLALTGTRSAWIAMAITLAGHALFVDRRWLILLCAAPALLLIPEVNQRLADLDVGNVSGGYDSLNSYAWRQLLWEDTLAWMADNPARVFGNGLDLYQSYVPQFFELGAYQAGVGPHNTFLQIYFEMGALGLAGFALMFIGVLAELTRRISQDFRGTLLIILMCIGYLIENYSDNLLDYLQFQWFFWFCVGAVRASARLPRPEPTVSPARSEMRGARSALAGAH
jgi:O-antigen ligase